MTATTTKPTRTCGWVVGPFALADGRLHGGFTINDADGRAFFKAVQVDADDMETVTEVSLEQRDGSFAPAVYVTLPAAGCSGRTRCTCPAFKRFGGCRHAAALKVLMSK
jgi:hypothetical protein